MTNTTLTKDDFYNDLRDQAKIGGAGEQSKVRAAGLVVQYANLGVITAADIEPICTDFARYFSIGGGYDPDDPDAEDRRVVFSSKASAQAQKSKMMNWLKLGSHRDGPASFAQMCEVVAEMRRAQELDQSNIESLLKVARAQIKTVDRVLTRQEMRDILTPEEKGEKGERERLESVRKELEKIQFGTKTREATPSDETLDAIQVIDLRLAALARMAEQAQTEAVDRTLGYAQQEAEYAHAH